MRLARALVGAEVAGEAGQGHRVAERAPPLDRRTGPGSRRRPSSASLRDEDRSCPRPRRRRPASDLGVVDRDDQVDSGPRPAAPCRRRPPARRAAGPLALCGCQPLPIRWASSQSSAPASSGAWGRTWARPGPPARSPRPARGATGALLALPVTAGAAGRAPPARSCSAGRGRRAPRRPARARSRLARVSAR